MMILFTSEILAQGKPIIEKSGIHLLNNRTHELKIIHEKTRIKYWLFKSNKGKTGRIESINDSSFVVNGKEIKPDNIRKIGIRNVWTIPVIIAGAATWVIPLPGFSLISPLAIVAAINMNKTYDLTKKWQFVNINWPIIDSSKFEPYKEEIYFSKEKIARKKEKIAKRDARSQNDSARSFSFTLNLSNMLFNQYTLEMGYQLNKKISIGIGGGIVKANSWYHRFYDGTDDNYPTGVYNGWLMNVNFKKLNISKHHWYFQTSLFYKYLWYDHIHFINTFGDQNPDVEWIRSEVTNVFGFKLMVGKKIILINHFAIEPVFGISLRERQRSYIDYWTNGHMDTNWGILHRNQFFPGLQGGLLLTFGNFRIK